MDNIQYFSKREDWRKWLSDNFETASDVWFVFPTIASGEECISYNDAVEEALCFGWIDSNLRTLDKEHKLQHFTPRNPKSKFSQSNKERLKWLLDNNMIHPKFVQTVKDVLAKPFEFPNDIIERLKEDPEVWEHFSNFPEGYRRIRVAYIEQARVSKEHFEKRIKHLIETAKANKMIAGYGGIDKYY